jgi:hypothetical protein
VSGCYILRPNAYAIWEHIQVKEDHFFNKLILIFWLTFLNFCFWRFVEIL